ncbi:MAG: GNAT family N-acetyltransferase [Nevskiaceae bacterium]|nr:MAG: GNAT family N-acetyltransferase [Nevskiaceae bacterium]
MLHIVETHNRSSFTSLLDEMHVLRARVFKERLQWDVNVVAGREIDEFDSADPLYILSVNERTQRLQGSVRLLPTTGPNMLRDVFSVLLPNELVVESPTIWESSRFCIDPDLANPSEGLINRITTELLCGLVEVGLQAGLSHIVSVYDARMARIFRASNCPAEVIGTPTRIGRVLTYAGLFEITQDLWNSVASTGGVFQSVVLRENLQAASAA